MASTGAFTPRPRSGSFSRRILAVLAVVLAVAWLGSGIGYLSRFNVSTETSLMVDDVMVTERLASGVGHHIAAPIDQRMMALDARDGAPCKTSSTRRHA